MIFLSVQQAGIFEIQQQFKSQNRSTTEVTYARPLQKQQQPKIDKPSPNTCSSPNGHRVYSPTLGDDSQQPSSQHTPTTNNLKPLCTSNHTTADVVTATTKVPHIQQQQKVCRPTVLDLVNTTTGKLASKNFDPDRPLPAPPRSSDTVAGRQRHHHDPRRRRRQQQHDELPIMTKQQEQQQKQGRPEIVNDRCAAVVAWPSASSFRSPISAGSFVSMSSLSSSGSTDAGNTTTSNNNYNTTTTASSSDDSYSRTEDDIEVGRVDIEDFDTAASSAAVSPVHYRYRPQQQQQQPQQQQHLLLRQWSPSTTTNSSPVRRSSSFRSPLSANTGASSSSLRSPPVVGHSNTTTAGIGGTQSLNRRRLRPANASTGGGAGNSGRRRRRRQQQQQNNIVMTGQSTPPSNFISDIDGLVTTTTAATVATEKYESPPSSPWKKHQQQQQRRQVSGKEQGTVGTVTSPDFTNEIRRILLLDHHRGNVRQQQNGIVGEDDQVQVNKHHDDSKSGKK